MRDNVKCVRRKAIDLGKIFAKNISEKGLLSNIYKELLKLSKKTIHLKKRQSEQTLHQRYTDDK